ncbi:MAG: molybdopterin-guanine dinucleotide biosynthesis protein B [Chloroflexota bacterium]
MTPIVSIVGKANSGKTTLLVDLIGALKKSGLSVAVVKHAGEDFDIDTEGKDSWRFRQAGAEAVAVSSPRQLAIVQTVTHDLDPEELSRSLNGRYDLIITEGFKKSNTPKIEVHRSEQGPDLISDPKQLLAVVTDEPLSVTVPQFPREDVLNIAKLIIRKVVRKE